MQSEININFILINRHLGVNANRINEINNHEF